MTVALDSNVFIAYLAKDDAFYNSANILIQQIAAGELQAVCSSIVFGEIVYTTSDPKSLAAVDAFFADLASCSDRPADMVVCRKAAQLRQTYPALKLPDALHLATAVVAQANSFVTADRRLLAIAKREIQSTYLTDFL
ncbi:MAG: type II toxin-antitoxin system VapC family toxin [Patescibacteria group bacterium]